MKEILKGLEQFRKDRNINDKEFLLSVEVSNLLEEVKEYKDAENDYYRVDALCDLCVFSINALYYLGVRDIRVSNCLVDCSGINLIVKDIDNLSLNKNVIINLKTIINRCFTIMYNMGYDAKVCMLETIKEISSREQDPLQKQQWEKGQIKGQIKGKWLKNPNQNKKTLYKAKYEKIIN